ncbi:substrate-binding domain-containing protein [Bradyrhizobium sp. JYMT SZCCT0428]|uniref:substrate-binding domain-containing protein n=1 Tax=Bradyrhizobium sp. JYMT SZCCT0428 TaxID=2807673 RepID=UPI002012B35A|nr:substrate-binding domain-containing protein [Bradyrhizobium sp. JYMT SZCCT0428]
MQFEVLIVGGGPAGLSAALILGRCHRKALLCDEGRQRNLSSHAIHGLLGGEGRSPSDFLDEALEELSRYKSVEVRGTRVTDIVPASEAFKFVGDRLKGKANVVLLTHDSLQFLAPRFVAMRDSLKAMPRVAIVADISPITVNKEGGLSMMQTIMLAHPDIDVVLGADTVVLGALAAVRQAGKMRPDQFFGGIDGEPEAVDEIKQSGPYKISISLASSIFGYAMGQHAADWLEGRSIPQAMDILPSPLTLSNISQYESDLANPGAVYNDPARRDAYLKMYGNICYDSRDQYVNFPWSSERR